MFDILLLGFALVGLCIVVGAIIYYALDPMNM